MRVRKVNRYYCDHCKKSGGQKSAMERHEKGCIRNPDRKCGFCASHETWVGEFQHEKSLPELITILQNDGMQALKDAAGNCPGCVFAAIVQSRETQVKAEEERVKSLPPHTQIPVYQFGAPLLEPYKPPELAFPIPEPWQPKEGWLFAEEYDFKAECSKFWSVVNECKYEQEIRGGY